MSHFTVLVVLDKSTPLEGVNEALEDVLAPYSENLETEPRREYLEEATPADHWQYKYVYGGEDGVLALPSSEPTTWEQYAVAYNEHNGHDGGEGGVGMQYDAELGKAYQVTTYNPLSKWDWWTIGGRWANSLVAKPSVDVSALLVSGGHWTEQYGNEIPKGRAENGGIQCDGGRLVDMDLEFMHERAIAQATEEYDRFFEAIGPELLAETKPWSHFYELAQAGAYAERVAALNATVTNSAVLPDAVRELVGGRGQSEVFPRDIARHEYNAQPGIIRLNEREEYRYYFGCVIEKFSLGRAEYIKRAGMNFLPGYAMVTLDGQWLASGEMGWFGMGSDEPGTVDAFKLEARAYLRDQVDQESIVVLVDCHI